MSLSKMSIEISLVIQYGSELDHYLQVVHLFLSKVSLLFRSMEKGLIQDTSLMIHLLEIRYLLLLESSIFMVLAQQPYQQN